MAGKLPQTTVVPGLKMLKAIFMSITRASVSFHVCIAKFDLKTQQQQHQQEQQAGMPQQQEQRC
jgi:hypothetical protein